MFSRFSFPKACIVGNLFCQFQIETDVGARLQEASVEPPGLLGRGERAFERWRNGGQRAGS